MYYIQPSSSVPWILQARILEWVAIPIFSACSQPRDWTQVSHIAGRFFTIWATREAPPNPWGPCLSIVELLVGLSSPNCIHGRSIMNQLYLDFLASFTPKSLFTRWFQCSSVSLVVSELSAIKFRYFIFSCKNLKRKAASFDLFDQRIQINSAGVIGKSWNLNVESESWHFSFDALLFTLTKRT